MNGYPIVLNGDHADFEREHANTPPQERPDWPLSSFDSQDWAKAFCNQFIVSQIAGHLTKPVDDQEGLMIGWFANALMRGFDEHASKSARPAPTASWYFWKFVHNALVHPLLALPWEPRWAQRAHDWTARRCVGGG